MSFSDTVFLFFLALILFGPKKLPEMARKAGRLMADLRRASNEFRSQIETEIAHLETEKPPNPPPAAAPQGTVASLSLTPVSSQAAPHESPDTLAGPATAAPDPVKSSADNNSESTNSRATEAVIDPNASAPRESHV